MFKLVYRAEPDSDRFDEERVVVNTGGTRARRPAQLLNKLEPYVYILVCLTSMILRPLRPQVAPVAMGTKQILTDRSVSGWEGPVGSPGNGPKCLLRHDFRCGSHSFLFRTKSQGADSDGRVVFLDDWGGGSRGAALLPEITYLVLCTLAKDQILGNLYTLIIGVTYVKQFMR